MKEKLNRFFHTKPAKIGLAAICVAAILAGAFLLQPTAHREIPADDTSRTSLADSDSASSDEQSDSTSAESSEATSDTSSATQPTSGESNTPSSAPGMDIDPGTGKDRYQTDPVPEGKPAPVEPEDVTVDGNKQYTCTLSIRCDTILQNLDSLKEEKKALLPADGEILATTTVTFSEGESVFDVLKRVTRQRRIHMEFSFTPLYNSAYIKGIHNLYEFDCGNLSGWMYKVNGWFPNYGCSRYSLKQGDVIEWVYTCDLGRDVGGGYSAGQGEAE